MISYLFHIPIYVKFCWGRMEEEIEQEMERKNKKIKEASVFLYCANIYMIQNIKNIKSLF